MNDPAPQSTLRQWRGHMGDARVLAALGGVGVILGISGPFGTMDSLSLVARLIYWTTIAAVTWSIGVLVFLVLNPLLRRRDWGAAGRVLAQGIATGLVISVAVGLINLAAFGFRPQGLAGHATFVLTMVTVAVVVTALRAVLTSEDPPRQTGTGPRAPSLLERLPLGKRGRLLALSAEDHYVRVRTDLGDHMILMRLSDAIAETAPEPGLQVHRSHWAARAAVATARRQGDRAILTLTTGAEIPVSRANVAQLRAEGLL